MDDSFCVGMRTKAVPLTFKLAAQIGEVIDLTVVGNPHRSIFVAHRHMAIGGEIENGEAAASQPNVSAIGETPLPQPGIIGTAMGLHIRHPGECLRVAAIHESADTAHGLRSSLSAARRSWP